MLKPRSLRKGDLIGLVSPASTPSPADKVQAAVRYLEGRGYRVMVGDHVTAEHGYLAGRDEERASDFNRMVRQSEVKAILATRGGYGSPRILPMIDYAALRRSPKIISGFSDITALQLAIYKRCGLVTFSGPMPAVEFWKDPDPYTEENFWRLVTSRRKAGRLLNPPGVALTCIKAGASSGILLGGNLSLIVTCLGTRFLPLMDDTILVAEEVDEAPYRVDRMLRHILNSNLQARLSGVVFGQFTRCEPKDTTKPHFTTDQVLEDFASEVSCPVIANLQYGHVPRKLTLPFGLRARIDSSRLQIEITESAVV